VLSLKKDIELIIGMQRRATKLVSSLKDKNLLFLKQED
jgi:hypothetical protein